VEVPPSPLNPTNTLCALVAATLEGPDSGIRNPATKTFEPLVCAAIRINQVDVLRAKSATTSLRVSGVSAIREAGTRRRAIR